MQRHLLGSHGLVVRQLDVGTTVRDDALLVRDAWLFRGFYNRQDFTSCHNETLDGYNPFIGPQVSPP